MSGAVEWINVGSIDNIPLRGARRLCVTLNGRPLAIFRTSDDRLFALVDVCPHKKGPLSEGIISGTTVTCPLHNWNIRLDDGKAVAPDEGATTSLPVKITGGDILVGLPVEAGTSV